MDQNKIMVQYVIRSGEDSPDYITQIIGLQPTRASYKNITRLKGGKPRVNLWVLRADDDKIDISFEESWKLLSNILEPKLKVINSLKYADEVQIIIEKYEVFPNLIIPDSMLEFCSKMSTEIRISMYDMTE